MAITVRHQDIERKCYSTKSFKKTNVKSKTIAEINEQKDDVNYSQHGPKFTFRTILEMQNEYTRIRKESIRYKSKLISAAHG